MRVIGTPPVASKKYTRSFNTNVTAYETHVVDFCVGNDMRRAILRDHKILSMLVAAIAVAAIDQDRVICLIDWDHLGVLNIFPSVVIPLWTYALLGNQSTTIFLKQGTYCILCIV